MNGWRLAEKAHNHAALWPGSSIPPVIVCCKALCLASAWISKHSCVQGCPNYKRKPLLKHFCCAECFLDDTKAVRKLTAQCRVLPTYVYVDFDFFLLLCNSRFCCSRATKCNAFMFSKCYYVARNAFNLARRSTLVTTEAPTLWWQLSFIAFSAKSYNGRNGWKLKVGLVMC